jgi:heptosyltransferase-3
VTQPALAERIAKFVGRARASIGWRRDALRSRIDVALQRPRSWRVARRAPPVIDVLARLKTANPGRPFCGILLIEHIGDIIACGPIVAQLKETVPNAFVVWVVKPQFAMLLEGHPQLDAIVHADSLLIVERIVESGIFDQVIDLHVNAKPTDVPARPYRKTTGDPSIDARTYVSKGSLLRAFSLSAGIEPRSAAPTLHVSNEAIKTIDNRSLPNNFVVVHAVSNGDYKNWTAPNWRALARYILDRYDTHVIEIGLERAIDLDHPRFKSFCGSMTILETAELIRRSSFFVGIDSGPAHMANAWRRPALLLFSRWFGSDAFQPFDGFYGENANAVIVRYPGPLRELPIETVIAALEASPMWRQSRTAQP